MIVEKIQFQNADGYNLSGRLELPIDQAPHNFAIFAHCFTCSKSFTATRNISRALTAKGFGVLRFDFTGLGDSDGDFGDTNFSGNVEDLLAAINYLEVNHKAPTLAVGHSLGGAAVIFASAKAKSIKAVATVGTPSDTKHVKHLFGEQMEAIIENGEAIVQLSGRPFKIKEQFLRDVDEIKLTHCLNNLKKPLLICHSPQDDTVTIDHAEKLYKAARHPKSFISLDGADHLLTNKNDSHYVGKVIAEWSSRYMDMPEIVNLKTQEAVVARLEHDKGFTTQLQSEEHSFIADEPLSYGGNNYGPTPYDLLSSGLAACTVMTLQMYCKRKNWKLEFVECHVTYGRKHALDCEDCDDGSKKVDTFTRILEFPKDLDKERVTKLLSIADRCPVHKSLITKTQIITKLL